MMKMVGAIYEEDEGYVLSAEEVVKVKVAMDSGACDNVIDPDDLPDDCVITPDTTGKHFRGAHDSIIENCGDVGTILESDLGAIGCGWKAAAVSRPLHSVSKVAGPPGGIKNSKQDILFNNEKCYVVAPGVVKKIMESISAIAEYEREGNLYIGEMIVQSFHRHGPTK